MALARKVTVYIEPQLHKAVRVKAEAEDRSVSDLVNEALRYFLLEGEEDLSDVKKRKNGPFVSYDQLIESLKKDGLA